VCVRERERECRPGIRAVDVCRYHSQEMLISLITFLAKDVKDLSKEDVENRETWKRGARNTK
jgi:hypothetical protein